MYSTLFMCCVLENLKGILTMDISSIKQGDIVKCTLPPLEYGQERGNVYSKVYKVEAVDGDILYGQVLANLTKDLNNFNFRNNNAPKLDVIG